MITRRINFDDGSTHSYNSYVIADHLVHDDNGAIIEFVELDHIGLNCVNQSAFIISRS